MRTISERYLKDILDKHEKWVRSEEDGIRADLSGANLHGVYLRYANLRGADFHGACLRGADFHGTDFRGADLSGTDFCGTDLSGTDFRGANLRGANLREANLSGAHFHGADLSGTDFRYANLQHVSGFKFAPIQIVNTKYFVTIFDDHVLWGCRKMSFDEVKAFKFSDCTTEWDESEFKLNKKIITEMIRYYRKEEAK